MRRISLLGNDFSRLGQVSSSSDLTYVQVLSTLMSFPSVTKYQFAARPNKIPKTLARILRGALSKFHCTLAKNPFSEGAQNIYVKNVAS